VDEVFIYFENEIILSGLERLGTVPTHPSEMPLLIFSMSNAGHIDTLLKNLRIIH
jgi:hypothetical protein